MTMKERRTRRRLVFSVCAGVLVLLGAFAGAASAKVWTVNDDGGADFTSIQAAVDNAASGDSIIVRDGKYNENVVVNKRLTIRSENGSANCIVSAAVSTSDVFEVTVDYVNISGFTVQNATGGGFKVGIYLGSSVNYCNISNNYASNNDVGIELFSSSSNTITNNTASNNSYGICMRWSSNNTLTDNTASDNFNGIYLSFSSNHNTITNNTASNNSYGGICMSFSSNHNTLTNNTANSNNGDGIYLYYSSDNNTLTSNTASNNGDGIELSYSSNNTLTDNTMVSDGIFITGDSLEDWNTHTIDASNTVNSKPVYYLKDVDGGTIPQGAGQVILANCTKVVVENQDLSNGSVGIELAFSSSNTLTNNTANSNNNYGIELDSSSNNTLTSNTANSNNYDGIYLYYSSDNTLTNNTASNNSYGGIYLYYSSDNNTLTSNTASNNNYSIYLYYSSDNTLTSNTASDNYYGIYMSDSSNNNILYHNNLINNTDYNAYDPCTNTWDSGSAGNYYSDYNGTDLDGDGIGKDPYPIPGGTSIDHFPLMQPWPWTATPPKGDLNGDRRLTPADAAIALQLAASGGWDANADVSGDHSVTSLDALIILQAAAGAIDL